MPAIEATLRTVAHELGFAAVGIARVGPSQSNAVFRQWLDQGMAAGMDYLHRQAEWRCHPHHIDPEARSIIALAARYPQHPSPGNGFCMLARTRDYHDVLRGKLRQLAAALHAQQPLALSRICVDSAPLPEREWAIRAGLGWQGRQGQLIVPDAGACCVLGFLLVDLEIAPSVPLADRCGSCRRCVTSCPTAAIQPHRQVDARRCLSYLTIEHNDEIPPSLQPALRNTLFGCDICTAVCPWNRSASAPIMPELAEACKMPEARELHSLSDATFKALFQGTTVKRSGRGRLRRNAAIVLSNQGHATPGGDAKA